MSMRMCEKEIVVGITRKERRGKVMRAMISKWLFDGNVVGFVAE